MFVNELGGSGFESSCSQISAMLFVRNGKDTEILKTSKDWKVVLKTLGNPCMAENVQRCRIDWMLGSATLNKHEIRTSSQ